jgi:S-adenosylmethionine:tRNA ribosyltransferase-isomerase
MHPKKLAINDFTYQLPQERIATYPLPQRDESKLLIYENDTIKEDIYKNLALHLQANTLLIFNDTKVVEARLIFKKSTGSSIELFCLEPSDIYPDITTAMLQKKKVEWKCLVGGAKKWREEILVNSFDASDQPIELSAKKIKNYSGYFLIEFSWNDDTLSFAEVLHTAGHVPLPPYLNRDAEETDKKRYQTIYALQDGSVAAPTAGLHFSEKIFSTLKEKKIKHDFVTLHVGAGTFKPVKSETIEEHEMHAEFIDVKKSFIQNLLQHLLNDVIAVGTTSLRTIESLYWLGVKTILQPDIRIPKLHIKQWEPYELNAEAITAKQALSSLIEWMDKNQLERLITKTQIIIAPGYALKVVKALITNFHQPNSTLLLLVAAITGDNWRKIYDYALKNNFRFLSYGDGCLLFPRKL